MLRRRLALISCLFTFAAALRAADWKPIDPADLIEKTPRVEKNADAEIIFSDTRISDEVTSGHAHWIEDDYTRIKVYNERGRDRYSTINIPIPPNAALSDIAARTIHPDGSITELQKDAIKETVSKSGNLSIKQKSFPLPAVEPGSIIEYRWKERHEEAYAHYVRLDLQRSIPARVVRYYIKPHASTSLNEMSILNFNGPDAQMAVRPEGSQIKTIETRQPDGYYLKAVENVPAFDANLEPHMPPADQLKMWSLIYYRSIDKTDADLYWAALGKDFYSSFKPKLKAGRQLHDKAVEITAKATDANEKLALLYEFCQRNIKNIRTDAVTAEEREEADKNKTPEDTLNQGMGTPNDIQFLFGAMAEALGFDARIALVPSRSNIFFSPNYTDPYLLRGRVVAIKMEPGWRFFDPAAAYVPNGMLFWRYEGVPALITDPKAPRFEQTPFSKPENSTIRNEGNFRLSEDGALEGNIIVSLTGHHGTVRKEAMLRQSEEQRQLDFEKSVKSHLSTAEVTGISIENANDLDKPVVFQAHVRVPGYAQRTGKRLFFAPAVFQQGNGPLFPNKERRYPVYFKFSWREDDLVTISIPEGFQFEAPQVPAPIPFGDLGEYQVHAKIQNGNRLIYTREFIYKTKGLLLPKESYPAVKTRFDAVAAGDGQTFTLKQMAQTSQIVQ